MGWHPVGAKAQQAISKQPTVQVHVSVAWRTPQFWLLWLVLWLNVTAGIGILGMASPMLQEIFLPVSYYPRIWAGRNLIQNS